MQYRNMKLVTRNQLLSKQNTFTLNRSTLRWLWSWMGGNLVALQCDSQKNFRQKMNGFRATNELDLHNIGTTRILFRKRCSLTHLQANSLFILEGPSHVGKLVHYTVALFVVGATYLYDQMTNFRIDAVWCAILELLLRPPSLVATTSLPTHILDALPCGFDHER
jgi:hypothetical protein